VAHDDVGQRGLAGTVGTHQGVHFALAYRQVDAAEDDRALGLGVEVASSKKGRRHGDEPKARFGRNTSCYQPRSTHSSRWGRSCRWWTRRRGRANRHVVAKDAEDASSIEVMMVAKSWASVIGVAGTAGKERVAGEEHGALFERKTDTAGRVTGCVQRAQA